ncbi:ribonuclease Z [Nibrella viscosa]|uniref:Ribonuclease Z n=2 Tax=Nibrella viscosa TaxID=1084524 RepID=A0ABP8K979_9BACT
MTENLVTAGMPISDTESPRPSSLTFTLTILGAGSATPTLGRHPTAHLLTHNTEYYLIDCGEGTQYRLLEQKIRPGRLHHIFISHLHGDHYFGLAPLLSSLNLAGRTEDLHLYGPNGLDEILTTIFRYSDTRLGYPLHFHPVDPVTPTVLADLPELTISSVPLEHRIACSGYLFREKARKPKLLRDKLPADVPVEYLKQLKEGHDIIDGQGQVIYAVEDYTTPGPPPRSYAFCSDTRYSERLIEQVRQVDLLYHEATFLEDNAQRAYEVFHSTARQAATIALKAEAGNLIIGHFSSRYKQFQPFLNEARQIFPHTSLATEGLHVEIKDWQY